MLQRWLHVSNPAVLQDRPRRNLVSEGGPAKPDLVTTEQP